MAREERITYRYSSNFIVRKVFLLLTTFLVGWAALMLIGYESDTNNVANTTNNQTEVPTVNTETENENTQTEPVETKQNTETEPVVTEPEVTETTAQPFSITKLTDVEPVITGSGDDQVYSYTLDNEALIEVRTNSNTLQDSDFVWTHRLNNDGSKTLEIVDTPTEWCIKANAGCSAGNGVLEVNIVPTSDSDNDYYVYLRDALVHSRDTALDFYGPIIESITLN